MSSIIFSPESQNAIYIVLRHKASLWVMMEELDDEDYAVLARFRFEIRRFLQFSEQAARSAGLTVQQHQALLIIRASEGGDIHIGDLADQLLLKPHSASELTTRLAERGYIERRPGNCDRREVRISLTAQARSILASLSAAHRAELRRLRPLLQRLLDAM
ncbi:MarR family winged helix-turn-helix transcriptional regulator [Methyloligella halotolerans]|uniref:MarR family winged helix-turn-helix transcriptional regulator n=1 Tax=Methyloligella halotolerans TaxID=1177755 RepID=UPI001FD9D8A4|nr:MarR family transcriptional regulator [Methyloligella halotolerans]